MAKNSGLTWQSYHYNSDWPIEWLAEHRKNNRYITSISGSAGKWFIVVSGGTGYTDQITNCGGLGLRESMDTKILEGRFSRHERYPVSFWLVRHHEQEFRYRRADVLFRHGTGIEK